MYPRWGLDAGVQGTFTLIILRRTEKLPVHINTCCQLPDSLLHMYKNGGCPTFRAATRHLLPSLALVTFLSAASLFQHHSLFPCFYSKYCKCGSSRFRRWIYLSLCHSNLFLSTMSACGYNDPEMLRAAIELAQSFSKSKGNGKKNAGGDRLGGRKEHYEPPPPRQQSSRQQSRYSQVAAPPRQTLTPSMPPSRPLAPPPSRRNYDASGDFATRRAASRPVIGNLGKDFITTSALKAEPPSKWTPLRSYRMSYNIFRRGNSDFNLEDEKATGTSTSTTGQGSQKGPPADKNNGCGGAAKPEPFSTPPRSSGNGQSGNILDAFYAILEKKPSIGQEIDTLANMLSKVMDLNATEPPALDTPPVKENVKLSSRQCTCQEFDGQGKTLAHMRPS